MTATDIADTAGTAGTAPDGADDTAVQDAAAQSGTRPQDPPVLVAATVGEVTAVWQVEVDARVVLGDFSGAWLVDADGVRGFAADADWIPRRASREEMLQLILARPVVVAGEGGEPLGGDAARASFGLPEDAAAALRIVDVPATVEQAAATVAGNKAAFSAEFPGKRQPAWAGAWADGGFTPKPGRAPEGLTGEDAEAVIRAMSAARGLRGLVGRWNALDKLRVQRLGGTAGEAGAPLQPLPLVTD